MKRSLRQPQVKCILSDEGFVTRMQDQGGFRINGVRNRSLRDKREQNIIDAFTGVVIDPVSRDGKKKSTVVLSLPVFPITCSDHHVLFTGCFISGKFVCDQSRTGQKPAEIIGGRGRILTERQSDIS